MGSTSSFFQWNDVWDLERAKKESKETGVLDRSYCLATGPQCNVQGSSAQSLEQTAGAAVR